MAEGLEATVSVCAMCWSVGEVLMYHVNKQGIKTTHGSSTAHWRMECTTRRHADSRKVSVAAKVYTTTQLDAHDEG